MPRAGDQIENPVTGQRIVFRRTSSETGGEVCESDAFFLPGGFAGPEHIHPVQDERFEVIAGQAGFKVRDENRVLMAGEALDVPRGVRHTFWNAGEDELHVRVWFRPGTPSTERFYELFFRMGREGQLNRQGMPSFFLIVMLAREFSDHVRLASPPWWLQNASFTMLRPLAKLLGFQGRAERLTSAS